MVMQTSSAPGLRHLRALQRHFGIRWLAGRSLYALKLRTGVIRRRLPARSWEDAVCADDFSDPALAEPRSYIEYRRARAPVFFFSPAHREEYAPLLKQWDEGPHSPLHPADGLARGMVCYFERTDARCGFPPDWHANPFTGQRAPAALHWTEVGEFDCGDIKVIWEPSRFGFAYTLVRAYWRTGDDRYAESFWQLVESWREQNPPQQGANWRCGQEAAFRAMAWCFGLYGFLESRATTAGRVAKLAGMLAVSADRIQANVGYALNQANNHGISEGVGLWTIGALFPEFRPAEKWRDLGRRILECEARRLIYADGAFVQHSVNYHRLMLHDYIWAVRLGELHGQPFTRELKERVGRAGEFLFQIQDEESGSVPYYGQNDGALVLPLSNCDYHDFRSVTGAAQFLTRATRPFDAGRWDEDLLWLFGPQALSSPHESSPRRDFGADTGGYYTLRSAHSFVFTRCAVFRHRPAQADMLHVDLWWRGQNIAVDAGTFSYNTPEPWNNAFAGTASHNTVTVDEHDQMDQVGRFIWLPWLRGEVRRFAADGQFAYFEGGHDGYHRLADPVTHRRAIVRLGDDRWLVLDSLQARGSHDYRVHWLLADVPYTIDDNGMSLQTNNGAYHIQMAGLSGSVAHSLVRADEHSGRGWRAPFYGHREPALSFAMTQRARSAGFWTLLSPDRCEVEASETAVAIRSAGDSLITVLLGSDSLLVSRILNGRGEMRVVA